MLQTIASLLIVLSLVSSFSLAAFRSAHLTARIKTERQANYAELRLRHLLKTILDDLDSHRFAVLPKIHPAGELKYSDGSNLPITSSFHASSNSNAVSQIKLDLLQTQRVKSSGGSLGNRNFVACPRFPAYLRAHHLSFHEDRYFNFLGVSLSGFIELESVHKSQRAAQGCRRFFLRPSLSTTIQPTPEQDLELIYNIIPITKNYTIYVDQAQQLRYVSHRKSKVVENQPVVKGINELKLSIGRLEGVPIVTLMSEFALSNGTTASFYGANRLGRTGFYNFLLNQ